MGSTENLKFCENEKSDPQFFLHFKQKYVHIIHAFGLSGVTLTPPAKNLVEVRNSKVLSADF
jgi:hypothetical protein